MRCPGAGCPTIFIFGVFFASQIEYDLAQDWANSGKKRLRFVVKSDFPLYFGQFHDNVDL